jgi:hypothetical protein
MIVGRAATALIVLESLLGLAGCASHPPPQVAYAAIGEGVAFGYKDHPNPDGGHAVMVRMPAYSTEADAQALWQRRGDELCPSGVAKRNLFRSERKESLMPGQYVYQGVGVASRSTIAFELEGYVYCKPEASPAAGAQGQAPAAP